MEELGLTQKNAGRQDEVQSTVHISKVLKGENLSLETLFKIEEVLHLKFIHEPEMALSPREYVWEEFVYILLKCYFI